MFAPAKSGPPRRIAIKKEAGPTNASRAGTTATATKIKAAAGAAVFARNRSFGPDSDLGRLLRSNFLPTESQKRDIEALTVYRAIEAKEYEALMDLKRATIQQYESSIARLREEIAQLKEQSEKAQKDISVASSLLSPIRTLPSEIMGEIFVACLSENVFAKWTEAPLLLCRVCSAWRDIARSTPKLWSHLALKEVTVDTITKFIPAWFGFAGDIPLSLSLVHWPDDHYMVICDVQEELASIPPVFAKIRRLCISSRYWGNAQSIGERVSSLLPAISDLKIEFKCIIEGEEYSTTRFPNLRRLRLSLFKMDWQARPESTTDFPMHFSQLSLAAMAQLTNLSMPQVLISPDLWHSLLRNCGGLTSGAFVLSEEAFLAENTVASSFSSIRSLEITFRRHGDWKILSGFSFPALRHLRLGSLEGLSMWSEEALMNIQARDLESLTLFRVKIGHDGLNAFLRSTPVIQSLHLDSPIDYNPLLESLSFAIVESQSESGEAQEGYVEPFLPELRELSLYQWRDLRKKDINVNGLLNLVKARWMPKSRHPTAPPGKRLERISIRTWRPNLANVTKSKLMLEQKQGLKLTIRVETKYDHRIF